MPIVFVCPSCQKKISAPDEAAGKKVRCPRCSAPAPVPMDLFEPAPEPQPEPVVEATVAPPKPKPAPVRANVIDNFRKKKPRKDDEDEERASKRKNSRDDDDDENRPRRRRRRDDDDHYDFDDEETPRHHREHEDSGGGGNTAMILVIVGGLAFLLLIGCGVGGYFAFGDSDTDADGGAGLPPASTPAPPPIAQKTQSPFGWKPHTSKDGVVKACIPGEPLEFSHIPPRLNFGSKDLPQPEQVSTFTSTGKLDSYSITVMVMRFNKEIPETSRNNVMMSHSEPGVIETRNIRWLGADAVEFIAGNGVKRSVCLNRYLIVAGISMSNKTARAPANIEAGFFDNIEYLK